jgi:hypothetical protein
MIIANFTEAKKSQIFSTIPLFFSSPNGYTPSGYHNNCAVSPDIKTVNFTIPYFL